MRAPAGHSRELSTSPPELVKELVTAPNLGPSPSQCGGRGLAQGDVLPSQAVWPWSGPHHPGFRASPVRWAPSVSSSLLPSLPSPPGTG